MVRVSFSKWVIFEQEPADPWEKRTSGGRNSRYKGGGGSSAFSSQHQPVASPKLVLSAFVSLLSPVRLVPPHSLQIAHVETHRCNITWTISQVSHYIQNDVEFEARTRSVGHSWEVSIPGSVPPALIPPCPRHPVHPSSQQSHRSP